MSEPDRLLARPDEFAGRPEAVMVQACWRDWQRLDLTPHDGVVPPAHPALLRALGRTHSATSLTLLIRNPIGFMLKYALGMHAPELDDDPLDLDHLQFGKLVHEILDLALGRLVAADGSLPPPAPESVLAAVGDGAHAAAERWEAELPIPPALLWQVTLQRAKAVALNALLHPLAPLAGQRSFSEVNFGWAEPPDRLRPAGWDATRPVAIPDTGLVIRGLIDRIDLSADQTAARVVDYKSGRAETGIVLRGGRELQRCLYGYAVHALLGTVASIEAALLYPSREPNRPQDNHYAPLEDPDATLTRLTGALTVACDNLRRGLAVPGIAAGLRYTDTRRLRDDNNCQGEEDDLGFALPVVPGTVLEPKKRAARPLLGAISDFWEVP